MRRLPPLVTAESRWSLPLADASAVALVELLLTDADDAATQWTDTLAKDPALALWATCGAAGRGEFPKNLRALATWLEAHAVEVLQWADPGDTQPDRSATSGSAKALADRVAAAVEVSELAALLAADAGQSEVEQARLHGLLFDAEAWLAAALADSDGPLPLPDWLLKPADSPATKAVDLAAEVLADRAVLPEGIYVDLTEIRRNGSAARRQWLASVGGVAECLPSLTAKLARLAALETDFKHTLQTEKLEAMAEFAAGAGHEVNNPLTVIAGRAQLFLRDETDPERRRALALMNAQAMRVYEMIADMMLFARPPQPEPEPVDLAELVDRFVQKIGPTAESLEIALRRTGDAGPVEMVLDPSQITTALQAMCQNAMEAIGREGEIEIDVQAQPSEVTIRIADDGPGITAEEHRHIFDPYYSARQAGRGLGLGLSKAWRIVTNHGGRIDVDSQPGHGAVFTVTLPR